MTAVTTTKAEERRSAPGRIRDFLAGGLKDRAALLLALIIVLLVAMAILDGVGLTSGRFNSDYLASPLIAYVPLALLALAELFVITSGRGGPPRPVLRRRPGTQTSSRAGVSAADGLPA